MRRTYECLLPDGTTAPCGPGVEQCVPYTSDWPLPDLPRFHLLDPSCVMNDPNGPVYDDVHGMYHVFFQDHLAIPPGGGPVWAHVCSRDLVHWARLPVALWNDEAYDSQAIFTGSATVFLDQIVQVYPGICTKDVWPECETGTTLALALPANRSDPFLTNWTKPFELNPIANNTQRDPTSAWRTAHGEWRLSTYDAELFATADFKEWYRIGTQPGFEVGECPSLMPLPRSVPSANISSTGRLEAEGGGGAGGSALGGDDASPSTRGATLSSPTHVPRHLRPDFINDATLSSPTHVHKWSHDWVDSYRPGVYIDGPPGKPGVWTPTVDWAFGNASQVADVGAFYASKDLAGPEPRGRRIVWGWTAYAGPFQGVLSLAREVTWHPVLRQLLFSPLAEQDGLRQLPKLVDEGPIPLGAGGVHQLGTWAAGGAGRQSEVEVSFALPRHAASFGVSVMGDGDGTTGMLFFAEYVPPPTAQRLGRRLPHRMGAMLGAPHAIRVGSVNLSISTQYQPWMPNTTLWCCDYTSVNGTDAAACQAACVAAAPTCAAWTFSAADAQHGAPPKCTLRSAVANTAQTMWRPPIRSEGATSGVLGAPSKLMGGKTDTLLIAPTDTNLTIRVYVDHGLAEGFWQGGRVAMTRIATPAYTGASEGFAVHAVDAVTLVRAEAWRVGDIWVSAEEVLRTPRPKTTGDEASSRSHYDDDP